MRTTTTTHTPADIIIVDTVTVSITLPKSEILDFYREARSVAATSYGKAWKHPEWKSIDCGSHDIEWQIKQPFNRPMTHGIQSRKGILAGIHKRMKSEPCEYITVQISGELWENVQTIAAHYGITPADHCRICFGYHAALWRREAHAPSTPAASAPCESQGPNVIPFMPHRQRLNLPIPALA